MEIWNNTKFLFEDRKGVIYIGGEKLTAQMMSALKDESIYILNSRLWAIFDATIINEAAEIALNKSLSWDHVLSAKQLYYWRKSFLVILKKLAQ